MRNDIYTLPQDKFVGGQAVEYRWRLYSKAKTPFDASGCEGNFALIDYSHKFGESILSKTLTFITGDEGVVNVACVTLDSGDTVELSGKYVYQLIIKDADGNTEIPNQGFFLIYKNINEGFLQS
jgi:hypothetical protein